MYLRSAQATNGLLDSLPQIEGQLLLDNCEHIELRFNESLCQAGKPMQYVFFATGSIIALLTPIEDNGNSNLGIGLIGNEGMLGITLSLGIDTTPYHALVQGSGSALRIPTPLFLSILEHSPVLQHLLRRFLYKSISQLVQTAGCSHYHRIEPRLARWLLMTQDRAHSETFHLTHTFLANILGVRRVGITYAANSIKKRMYISYRRGDITILDQGGLEALSCSCYGAVSESSC